jgi:peptidoglycan/xylan/chitin deacetylase (PgdA/CDA1 family)
MTQAECRALLGMGFALGAHGRSHDRFAELDGSARIRELTQSLDFMESAFGLSRTAFAFPHSHRGVGRDWMAERMAADARLSIFFGTGGFAPSDSVLVHRVGLDRPPQDEDPFDIASLIAAAYGKAG